MDSGSWKGGSLPGAMTRGQAWEGPGSATLLTRPCGGRVLHVNATSLWSQTVRDLCEPGGRWSLGLRFLLHVGHPQARPRSRQGTARGSKQGTYYLSPRTGVETGPSRKERLHTFLPFAPLQMILSRCQPGKESIPRGGRLSL